MERKPNAASDQTKHALAEALKTLMAQKPFDKITIRDISELAGIRRQNFYCGGLRDQPQFLLLSF